MAAFTNSGHKWPGAGRFADFRKWDVASTWWIDAKQKKRSPWQHSYVVGDKTFCVYLAENEDANRRTPLLTALIDSLAERR